MPQFDYIIIGAGSSGCVLADRLSADGCTTLLLLKAGSDNETKRVNMPRALMKIWDGPRYFWQFPVKAQDRRPAGETWFYGRGLGGSSFTNGTRYMRGEPADYDAWHALGLAEWSWAVVERCYRKMECYEATDAYDGRGRHGSLQVRKLPFRSHFFGTAIQAADQMGLLFLPDINTRNRQGIGYSQASVDQRGRRASACRMFLKPAMSRPNLKVVTGALVERVELNEKRARVVRFRVDDQLEIATCNHEVILSTGALQSPKLPRLSGIDPAAVLQ